MSTAGTPARPVGMTVQVGGRAIQLPPWQALAAPVFIVMMLAMMILPLPALLLDLFFTFNIAVAVVVLLVSPSSARAASMRSASCICSITPRASGEGELASKSARYSLARAGSPWRNARIARKARA